MKRILLIVLLSLGTIGGFAAGCRSLALHRAAYCAGPGASEPRCAGRRAFIDGVADVCVSAARHASETDGASAAVAADGKGAAADRTVLAANVALSPDRAAAAVDRAAAAAERAAAAAERAAASVERAAVGREPNALTASSPAQPAAPAPLGQAATPPPR